MSALALPPLHHLHSTKSGTHRPRITPEDTMIIYSPAAHCHERLHFTDAEIIASRLEEYGLDVDEAKQEAPEWIRRLGFDAALARLEGGNCWLPRVCDLQ